MTSRSSIELVRAQAERNVALRTLLLERLAFCTEQHVARSAASGAQLDLDLAARWRAENRIVGVERGQWLFPAFQFDETGAPKRTLQAIIARFRAHGGSDWQNPRLVCDA